jgi:ABC-2 type transport system ATP-binding protein
VKQPSNPVKNSIRYLITFIWMDIISTSSLSKHFGSTVALDNITLNVRQGEIYGFLGLNGAGKTTLIRVLLGMVKPTSGTVKVLDQQVTTSFDKWNQVGYLVETPYAYPDLTVAENLKVYAHLRKIKITGLIDGIIDKLKLTQYKNKKAKVLSMGNQQRLGLAKALMHRPNLLILDEPINGLDPEGIVEVRELLQELVANGSTIFLSSHILSEMAKLATRIGIIHQGRLIRELNTDQLLNELQKKLLIQTNNNIAATNELQKLGYKVTISSSGEIEITDSTAISTPEKITQLLSEKGFPPKQIFTQIEDLEMYFLRTIKSTNQ